MITSRAVRCAGLLAGLLASAMIPAPASAGSNPARIDGLDGVWSRNVSQVRPVMVPPERSNPASVWWPGHGLVVMGGLTSDFQYLNDTWLFTTGDQPTWQAVVPSGALPGKRSYHSGVHDTQRDRFVIFGGRLGGIAYNDVWALSFDGGPHWTAIAAQGTAPTKRYLSGAIYDPLRDRVLVFGGRGTAGAQRWNDVWSLSLADPPTWTQIATAGTAPTPRSGQAAVYDAARDRMVVHAGLTSTGSVAETWALDLSVDPPVWTLLDAAGTGATETAFAAIDPARDRMLVWGGTPRAFDLATASWSTISVATPLNQWNSAVAYDPDQDAMLVTSGDGTSNTWMLDFAEPRRWIRHPRATPYATPTPIYGGSGTLDPVRDRIVMWDRDDQNYRVWNLDLSGNPTWNSNVFAGHPTGGTRDGHRVVHDSNRDRFLMFGGRYDGGYPAFNDVWSLPGGSLNAWQSTAPLGPAPTQRHRGGVIYDAEGDRLIVTGGLTYNGAALSDTWELPLGGPLAWVPLSASGAPPVLGACGAVYDAPRERMVVVAASGVWALSLTGSPAWTQLTADASPGLSLALDTARNRLVAIDLPLRTWSFPLSEAGSWTLLDIGSVPTMWDCRDCTVAYQPARDRLVVIGSETFLLEAGWAPVFETWFVEFSDASSHCSQATQVVSSTLGSGTWWPESDRALGAPDYAPFTLGTGGSAVFRLDHPAADGPGYDLYVHENGATESDVDENYAVEASSDGSTFVSLGSSSGSLNGFDLAGSGLSVARFVRIVDLAPAEAVNAGMEGADIDAIEVVHCSETADVVRGPGAVARSTIEFVRPNPGAATQAFDLRLDASGARSFAIYSANGRRVWSRDVRGMSAGSHVLTWDGRAANGRLVAPAVYFARLETADGASSVRRFVRMR